MCVYTITIVVVSYDARQKECNNFQNLCATFSHRNFMVCAGSAGVRNCGAFCQMRHIFTAKGATIWQKAHFTRRQKAHFTRRLTRRRCHFFAPQFYGLCGKHRDTELWRLLPNAPHFHGKGCHNLAKGALYKTAKTAREAPGYGTVAPFAKCAAFSRQRVPQSGKRRTLQDG